MLLLSFKWKCDQVVEVNKSRFSDCIIRATSEARITCNPRLYMEWSFIETIDFSISSKRF